MLMLNNTFLWNQPSGEQRDWAAKSHAHISDKQESETRRKVKVRFEEAFERPNAWILDWMIFHFMDILTDALGSIESSGYQH